MKLLLGNRWFSWQRILCLAVTLLIFFFLFKHIDVHAFLTSLKQTRLSWFFVGFLVYGLSIFLGALRWHFGLRLSDTAMHMSASLRLFLIGHFFFVILFGGVGGDLAKSAVYSRYFRFGMPEVISAALLERVYGFGGNVLLWICVTIVAIWSGGFRFLEKLNIRMPGVWFLAAVVLISALVMLVIYWRPKGESSWARLMRALRSGGGRIVLQPKTALPGLLTAFAAITVFSSILAFNLVAVTQTPLPWAKMLWTFPAVMAIGTMPFTAGGAGVREVAALTFLGLYGVPPGDCVAAAMLTLMQKLLWASIGAIALWREEGLFARCANRPIPQSVSVIIPTLNEEAAITRTIEQAKANPEVKEIIVVDGGSTDSTVLKAEAAGVRVLSTNPGRGGQLRLGAQQAQGDVVMLLHADTWLSPKCCHAALNCLRDTTVVAGGFWKRFERTPFLLLGSRLKCGLRLLFGRRIAGDQAFFIRREVLEEIGGVPDMPLMEEFKLSSLLRGKGRLALAEATVISSSRRFQKRGVLRTYWRMWYVTMLYRFGRSPQQLSRLYQKD